jgi:hypothetical protein
MVSFFIPLKRPALAELAPTGGTFGNSFTIDYSRYRGNEKAAQHRVFGCFSKKNHSR